MSFFKVRINDTEYLAEEGISILELAEANGIHIPTLCYEKGLSIRGSCRLCVVEVKGSPKLLASCATPVRDGMEILTESERVIEARQELLRLLLANHDLRCLTCPRNGDCRHRTIATVIEWKILLSRRQKELPVDFSNPFIRDYSKCIVCGKCVMFAGKLMVLCL